VAVGVALGVGLGMCFFWVAVGVGLAWSSAVGRGVEVGKCCPVGRGVGLGRRCSVTWHVGVARCRSGPSSPPSGSSAAKRSGRLRPLLIARSGAGTAIDRPGAGTASTQMARPMARNRLMRPEPSPASPSPLALGMAARLATGHLGDDVGERRGAVKAPLLATAHALDDAAQHATISQGESNDERHGGGCRFHAQRSQDHETQTRERDLCRGHAMARLECGVCVLPAVRPPARLMARALYNQS